MADTPANPINLSSRPTIGDGQVIDLRAFGVHVSASRNGVSIHGEPDLRTQIQWDTLYGLCAAARGFHERLARGEHVELTGVAEAEYLPDLAPCVLLPGHAVASMAGEDIAAGEAVITTAADQSGRLWVTRKQST